TRTPTRRCGAPTPRSTPRRKRVATATWSRPAAPTSRCSRNGRRGLAGRTPIRDAVVAPGPGSTDRGPTARTRSAMFAVHRETAAIRDAPAATEVGAQLHASRLEERTAGVVMERGERRRRMHAPRPADLRLVHVPDAGRDALVEQRVADRCRLI